MWIRDRVSIDLGFLGLGTFHLRWYALGYMAGIALAWWYASAMIRRPRLFGGTSPLTKHLPLIYF